MRILTIMTTKFMIDGITKVVTNNYKYLNKQKYEMDFIFPNLPSDEYLQLFKTYNSKVFTVPIRNKNTIKYLFELNNILKKNGYDIVHAHGNSPTLFLEMIVAKINNVPVRISHSHSTRTNYPHINKLLRPLFKKSYTHGIAVSEASGEWLFGEEDFYISENGIDSKQYRYNPVLRESTRQNLGYEPEHKVIGNIGRLHEHKNQIFLINLLSKLVKKDSNYRLLLVGDGNLFQDCKDEVNRLNLEEYVILLGKKENVTPYLMAMDTLVVPSLYEGLGITIVEAQAADLKCFVSKQVPQDANITGTVEYFTIDNYDEISVKLNNFFESVHCRDDYKLFSIVNKSSYNIVNSVKKIEKLYDSFFANYEMF